MRLTSLVFLSILVFGATPRTAESQVRAPANPDSVHFRNDCRQAAQTIRTGAPRDRVSSALAFARLCDGEARQLLIDRWLATATDPQSTDSVWREMAGLLRGLRDDRAFRAALDVARNGSLSLEARSWGMSVALGQIEPHLFLDPFTLRAIPPGTICGGAGYSSVSEVIEGTPMPSDAAQQLRDAMAELVNSAGLDTYLGRAADCARIAAATAAHHH